MGRTAGGRKDFLCSSLYSHRNIHHRYHVLSWNGDLLQDRIRIKTILDNARLCIFIQYNNILSDMDR